MTHPRCIVHLSHGRIREHLTDFEEHGLTECKADGERLSWAITQRGNQALEELRRVDRAMQDFGINL